MHKLCPSIAVLLLCIVKLNAQCPQASFTTTAPACQGSSISFTNTSGNTGGGWTYFWDFDYPNGGGSSPATSTNQNPTGVNYSPGGNGVYTVAFTIINTALGCTSTVLVDIDIRTARADFISSSQTVCVGDSINIYNTGTPGSSPFATITHSWSFGTGASPSTSNAVNPPPISYSSPGAKTITHLVTANYGGCGTRQDVFTQTISVNPDPSPSFSSTAPVCEGSSVNFTYNGSAAQILQWDFGQSSLPQNSSSQNPSGIQYSTFGNKTVTLTALNSFGCTASTTQTILINSAPVADFSSTAPQCTGMAVDFTNTGTSSGVACDWSFGSGSSIAASQLQNPSGIVYSTAGTKNIILVLSDTTSGCTDTAAATININQTPSVGFSSNAPQCAGTSLNFVNTGSSGSNWSYSWSFDAGSTPSISTSENPSGIVYGYGGSKQITLTISDGLCTNTFSASININSNPIANAGKDTTICANSSVQIGGGAIPGNIYLWFPVNTVSNAGSANPVVSPIASVTQYILSVTDNNGCQQKDTTIVTMLDPLSAIAGPDVEICRYDSVQIGAALIDGQNYSWSNADGLSLSSIPSPISSPSVTTTYTLSVTANGCGPVTDEVTVVVHQLPLVKAGPDDTITVGSTTQLMASGALQYEWSPSYGLNNDGIYNPVAGPDSTITYLVQGTDIYGCINYDTVTIRVIKPSFWVPTAFTPDGNDNNDIFYVRGEGLENFECRIFNRWGEEIFFSKDQRHGWDGKRQFDGENMPQGAYLYNVRGLLTDGTPLNEKGIVNLIR